MNRSYWLCVYKHTGSTALAMESHLLRLLEQEKRRIKRTGNVTSQHKGGQLWVALAQAHKSRSIHGDREETTSTTLGLLI